MANTLARYRTEIRSLQKKLADNNVEIAAKNKHISDLEAGYKKLSDRNAELEAAALVK